MIFRDGSRRRFLVSTPQTPAARKAQASSKRILRKMAVCGNRIRPSEPGRARGSPTTHAPRAPAADQALGLPASAAHDPAWKRR